jgi:signal transduction histidine kinase/ActR/RegA family two-component response regulator
MTNQQRIGVWGTMVAVFIAASTVAILQRTPWKRATAIILGMVLQSPVILYQFGPAPTPFLLLLMAAVMSALLIGPRAAWATTAFSLSLVVVTAWLHLSWTKPSPQHFQWTPEVEPLLWTQSVLSWLIVTGITVLATTWLVRRMETAFEIRATAVATALTEESLRIEADRQRRFTESALIEAQRHEAVGQLTGGASHDFNNAMFVILGWNDLLMSPETTEEQRRQGHAAIAAAGRSAADLAKRLVSMVRQKSGGVGQTLLKPLMDEATHFLQRLLPEHIRLEASLQEVPPVAIDPAQFQQLLLNLVLNARDAMPQGGRLTLQLRPLPQPPEGEKGSWIELSVSDTGIGMNAETRASIFQPWFTTKAAGMGTGLGLTTSQAIVSHAGGRIAVESVEHKGTTFHVLLPASGEAAPSEAAPSVPSTTNARARILVVEDDASVRALIVMALRGKGHEVREAADGDRAMQMLEEHGAEADLLCMDGIIPGVPSTRVIERFREMHPDRPVLVCSGYLGTPELHRLVQDGRLPYLQKPFSSEALCNKVAELLETASTLRN